MASPRTRRFVETEGSVKRLGVAIRARRKLQEEAKLLNRGIMVSQKRLVEINEEEEIHSAVIEAEGGNIAAANEDPPEPGAP